MAAYVKDLKAGKLDARAQMGRFVGYDSESKGYRIYWPGKRSVTVERNVVFDGNNTKTNENHNITLGDLLAEGENADITQTSPNSLNNVEQPEDLQDQPEDHSTKTNPDDTNTTNSVPFPSTQNPTNPEPTAEIPDDNDESVNYGRGHRLRKAPGAYKAINDGLTAAIVQVEDLEVEDLSAEIMEENLFDLLPPDFALIGGLDTEPTSIDEALRGSDAKEWEEALKYEINQLEKLKTWIIEDLPPGHKAIPSNEVLKYKRGPDGNVNSYRVRIVAGGHRQVHGVNYTETFSSAAKMPTVRVILANAAVQDWEIDHVDVKSAYLNAPLKETVYMKPPRGVLKPGQEGKVCRLLKGLYGLKQAGRGWYLEMSKVFLKDLGFQRSAIDHSVFY